MNLYQSNKLLSDLEDPFSSSLIKQIDSMDMSVLYLDKPTRVDLILTGQEDENNLPAYMLMNRVSDSLYMSVFCKPANLGEFDRMMLRASINS